MIILRGLIATQIDTEIESSNLDDGTSHRSWNIDQKPDPEVLSRVDASKSFGAKGDLLETAESTETSDIQGKKSSSFVSAALDGEFFDQNSSVFVSNAPSEGDSTVVVPQISNYSFQPEDSVGTIADKILETDTGYCCHGERRAN